MMEPISSPLQGALGYTLLGEILGVTALSWVCIGLMLRKLRHEAAEIPEKTLEEEAKPFKVEDSPEYLALVEKISQMEAEKLKAQESQSGTVEVEKMQKTISFLENKLLEYEIVQEEISSLGELKTENEKLKLELNTLKKTQPQPAEELIKKQFSEFSESSKEVPVPTEAAAPMPEEIHTLLSDIESLSKEKQSKP